MRPSYIFKDRNEMLEKLKYWQHVLALDSWIVEAELVEEIPNDSEAITTWGQNLVDHANCTAHIKIANVDDAGITGRRFDELTLVHELIHCILPTYSTLVSTDGTFDIPGATFDYMEERRVEALAKSFMKAKYNLEMKDFYKRGGYMK